jgi:putative colanic acid biosynthesis glycosyltransferase
MNSGDEFENDRILSKVHTSLSNEANQPALIYGDSIDIDEKNNKHYRRSKEHGFIKYGMITQHQAMFFNRHKITNIKFPEKYRLSADYAMISEVISSHDEKDLVRLDFPICRFRMGGVNESKRFQAIREDFDIRKNILKLSWIESSVLFGLHFIHARLKHSFKKTRFLKHKRLPA